MHNDRASRSASSRQCACPFYSSRAGFFGKTLHHPGLSAPSQPRFGSLRLLVFPKAKIAVEREEICECDGHTVDKFSQRRLTADLLVPRTVHGCAVRSPLTDYQVTSRPGDRFSRYSKWLSTFRADQVKLDSFFSTGFVKKKFRFNVFRNQNPDDWANIPNMKVKVKQSRYRPRVAQKVPGSYVSQIS
jgi:hypothetical protein